MDRLAQLRKDMFGRSRTDRRAQLRKMDKFEPLRKLDKFGQLKTDKFVL
jgi:hypothetical protein